MVSITNTAPKRIVATLAYAKSANVNVRLGR